MADQNYIQGVINQLSGKFDLLQIEAVSAIMGLVQGKTTTEALQILNTLNVNTVMAAKSANIVAAYTAGNKGLLLGKEMFAQVSESSLQILLMQSEQYLAGEITGMANAIKQEVIAGIMNDSTPEQIVEAVGKRGYAGGVGMKRIVTDGLNSYSRAVSRLMMEEAPENTKYIYIGPADEKTRPLCLTLIQAGAITLKEIKSMGWTSTLIGGGGTNCRHSWEKRSNDVRSQFYRKEEAEKILNA